MARSSQAASSAGYPQVDSGAFSQIGATLSDFLNLTKPGILGLLLISTCCPMVLAGEGRVSGSLVFYALLGGMLISASASVMNCVFDRDIDAVMDRTKNRPMASGRISVPAAMFFAYLLGFAGFGVLYRGLNPFAAYIALFGHFFYVVIYTLWLKRNTPQNIVIGGAAGAIPPLVGWVGITGELELDAVLLFTVIFLWTPPHFWALALNKNGDYRRANVPMLPVVSGERETERLMYRYAVALLPVSLALVLHNHQLGLFSLFVLGGLGTIFAFKIDQLRRLDLANTEARTKKAWDIFGFSLIYLALFFVCLVVDSAFI